MVLLRPVPFTGGVTDGAWLPAPYIAVYESLEETFGRLPEFVHCGVSVSVNVVLDTAADLAVRDDAIYYVFDGRLWSFSYPFGSGR